MKKMIFLLAIITIIAQSNPQKLMGEDCKFLCPEIDWQEHNVTLIPWNYTECDVLVYWSYRYVDCPEIGMPWCDFKLDSITCPDCPAGCLNNAGSLYVMTHSAIEALLKIEAKFKQCALSLDPGECSSYLSMNYSSCWTSAADSWDNQTISPCEGDHCCREVWEICRDGDGYFKPNLVATIGINPICQNNLCYAICETPPLKGSINPDTFNSELGDKVELYPNPTDITLYINYISISEGFHTFEVYDLSGNLVYSEDFNKSQNEISMQFNFMQLTNGVYNFVIKSDGKNRINGKFNIIK